MDKASSAGRQAGQNITRGEFLAAGATVAVGGAVRGVGGAEHEGARAPTPGVPFQQECRGDCPPPTEVWAIRAGVLNALWNDVLPRVVADAWYWGEDLREVVLAAADHRTALRERMHRFNYTEVGGTITHTNYTDTSGSSQPAHPLSPPRQKAFQVVDYYLSDPSPGRIPIHVRGNGGYDFLLSDKGLEIFIPEPPEGERDLLRYYSFRGTGRRAIGTPFYLEHAISATSTETATGPSEIRVRPEVFVEIVREERLTGAMSSDCADVIHCIATRLGVSLGEGLAAGSPAGLKDWGDRVIWDNRRFQPPVTRGDWSKKPGVPLTLEAYKCVVSGLRCWQMEGSAYRGIMTEFPRLAAWVWMEDYDQSMSSVTPSIDAYRWRIDDPVQARTVFQERLETMIDEYLKFQPYTLPAGTTAGEDPIPGEWRPSRWLSPESNAARETALSSGLPEPEVDDKDVVITNKGVFFPEIPQWSNAWPGGSVSTAYQAMLLEIADGRAGNPVFTDSMRTGGPGDGE